jgi:fibronectin-binding autotransporter adhesin
MRLEHLRLVLMKLRVPNPITTNTGAGENGSVSISADITLSGDITITDSLNIIVSGSHTATVDSDIAIADGENLVSYGVEGYATNVYDFGGIISGDGGIIVDDAHVALSGMSNTYTGLTELNNGALLTVTNNNSQGAQTSGTIVNSGTTLEFDSASNIGFGEPITVSGTGIGGSYPGALVKTGQNMQIEGGVTLAGDTTMHNATSELFEITSVISGAYNLTLTNVEDDGGFNFQPGAENNFGNLIATGTELTLTGADHTAVTNNLTVNAVDGKSSYVQLDGDNVIADDSVITLNNDSTEIAKLISNGVVDSVGTIVGDGTISMLDSDSRFNIGYGDITGTFEGVVEGYTNSQFQIVDGVWTFSGDNTDVGNGFSSYYVSGGTLIADAINTSLGFSPFSISSGVLGGTGVIGQVSAYAGTIAPGNSPGCLNPDGDVAFTEFSTLSVQIEGTDPCTGYDFLSASGAIALNDAQLSIELPDDYESNYGTEFMIVQGSVLAGTFAGLPDGDTIAVGDFLFRINYTSREVILTDITPATSASSSSSDTLANTGANQFFFFGVVIILLSGSALITNKYKAS